MKNKPKAVCISDVHYNLSNLPLADASLRQAINKAHELQVPLLILGDLHDTKANLRAECVNALIATFAYAEDLGVGIYLLIGNHCRLNEKAKEHSLNFLASYCIIISMGPVRPPGLKDWFIAYESDPKAFEEALSEVPKGSTVFCHQGVTAADMGQYIIDPSAVSKDLFADYRVISGHYHRAQDIKCGRPQKGAIGLFSYLGSPYTQSFAEAGDGEKGYSVLYDNGLLELVPTNLRRHRILTLVTKDDFLFRTEKGESRPTYFPPSDLVWLKISGPQSELSKIDKNKIGEYLQGHSNFKLEKIPTDIDKPKPKADSATAEQLMDGLIDGVNESDEYRVYLKNLWRGIMNA